MYFGIDEKLSKIQKVEQFAEKLRQKQPKIDNQENKGYYWNSNKNNTPN